MKTDKTLCGKYAVVRYRTIYDIDHGVQVPVSLVFFDETNPDKFYWGDTRSYCIILETTELIKVYKIKNFDRIYKLFMKKFYDVSPAKELYQSFCWVGPGGEFYPCSYGEHSSMAEKIYISIYGERGTYYDLREKGWLKLNLDGSFDKSEQPIPDAMKEGVKRLAEVGDDKWKYRLNRIVERYENVV